MKVVILAGGLGTRIAEETNVRPKPMIEIGGKPVLWHILKIYSHFGYNDFIICCGYKGYLIKEYFANYFLHMSDVTFHMEENKMEVHNKSVEPWKVTVVDTGQSTMTGGRLKRIKEYIGNSTFCMTYGDGLADVNIKNIINNHFSSGCEATVTAIQPAGRYGILNLNESNKVTGFSEKPTSQSRLINGGFFVLEPSVLNRIEGDNVIWEQYPMKSLAKDGQLNAYFHNGFWKAMDTLRDKISLEKMWEKGDPPWKVW